MIRGRRRFGWKLVLGGVSRGPAGLGILLSGILLNDDVLSVVVMVSGGRWGGKLGHVILLIGFLCCGMPQVTLVSHCGRVGDNIKAVGFEGVFLAGIECQRHGGPGRSHVWDINQSQFQGHADAMWF